MLLNVNGKYGMDGKMSAAEQQRNAGNQALVCGVVVNTLVLTTRAIPKRFRQDNSK